MRGCTAAALVAVAVVVVAGGWYFGTATTPPEQTHLAGGSPMFPGLADRLATATKLEITHQGRQTVIEKRPDGQWGVASMHGCPVQETKLRSVLTALTELRLTEPRTSNPSDYSRLAVDDPNGAKSEADLVRVVDAKGQTLATVIVGHRRMRGRANLPDEVYVRRPDEAQSWLAEGSVRADADANQWLNRDLMDIKEDRIASVVVGDKALVFGRVDGKFTLTEPADHPKLEDYKVDNVGRGLETLTMQAVKPDADVTGEAAGHSVFTTKDGLLVTVTLLHADKDVWARFALSGSDKAKAEADRLAARLNGWTYEIGSWKEKSLVPAMDDLKATEPAAPEAGKPVSPLPPAAAPAPEAGQAAAPDAEKKEGPAGAGNAATSPAPGADKAFPAPEAGKAGSEASQGVAPAPGADKAAPVTDGDKTASDGDNRQAAPSEADTPTSPAPESDKPAAAGTDRQEAPASGTGQK